MEDKITSETPEDVNENGESKEIDVDKLRELERNKTIALQEERNKNKEFSSKVSEYEAKLAEYEKKELELQEKEKLKKGKYEEVIEEQKAKLTELEEKAKMYDELITQRNSQLEGELTSLQEKVPEQLKAKYEKITSKLGLEDKISFYNNLIEDIKGQDYQTKPGQPGEAPNNIDQAKAKGFDSYMEALLKG